VVCSDATFLPPLDRDDDQKRNEEEWKKLENLQDLQEENPLEDILELMDEVHGRMVDMETGKFTQAEQKRIVDILEGQSNVVRSLDELIKKIEEMQAQQQSGSSSSMQQQQQQQSSGESEGERQKREEAERRRREQQRQMSNPQQQDQPKDGDQNTRNDEKRRGDRRPEDQGSTRRRDGDSRGWGSLPPKLHREVNDAQNQKKPERYRELIERYFRALAR
jgi:ribosomal protein L12E/L44/L45/RPP1/RPP2